MDILKRVQSEAEQVEVVQVRSESTTVSFEANWLKSSQVAETRGTALHPAAGDERGRQGVASEDPRLSASPRPRAR